MAQRSRGDGGGRCIRLAAGPRFISILLAAALAAGGCAEDPPAPVAAPVAAPSPTPTPSVRPTPPPRTPVVGVVEVTSTDTSWNTRLGLAEDPEPAPGSVEAAVSAVAASLDGWLDAAQAGTPDLALLGAAWLAGEDPAAAEVLRSGITSVDNPVTSATYLLDVHLEPDPTLVVADVEVGRRDGTNARVELVLDVGGAAPTLLLVGSPRAG